MKNNIEQIKEKANYCLNCKTKPCQKGCPLGNDIPSFIKCIKEDKYKEAYDILCQTTFLQPICGRICPHKSQCEGSCVRGIKGESVSIGELETFIGDMAIKNKWSLGEIEERKNKKVAIIGGGPAGLSAAINLIKKGYGVTIYEKYSVLGGLLNHGIPEFRLDKELLKEWINKILDLGIKVKYNCILGRDYTLDELKSEYDAILLSFGANISCKMNIDGEELDGVYGGNELLELNLHPNYSGKKVAIIGGGNVAMDTARTIKNLGAEKVTVIYRRAEEQMPAEKKEIQDAKKEGIEFLFQNNIVRILGNNENKVERIECIKTKLVQKETEARAVPINIEGSNYEMDIDYVVMAVGSKTEQSLIDTLGLELTKWGYIKTDENYMTSKEGIFAAGDLIGTKATIAWAARSGRDAADSIVGYLE